MSSSIVSGVSSASSASLPRNHPLLSAKQQLTGMLEAHYLEQAGLNAKMKGLVDELKDIEKKLNSPTTKSLYAKQCVFVKEGRAGFYRQLHITDAGNIYYFSKSFRKTKIDPDRPVFANFEIRAKGHSIWDGDKIGRFLPLPLFIFHTFILIIIFI